MLIAIVYLAYLHNVQHAVVTFDLLRFIRRGAFRSKTQRWLFAAFALSFAIKNPPVFRFIPGCRMPTLRHRRGVR